MFECTPINKNATVIDAPPLTHPTATIGLIYYGGNIDTTIGICDNIVRPAGYYRHNLFDLCGPIRYTPGTF